jgi:hypothetical protein
MTVKASGSDVPPLLVLAGSGMVMCSHVLHGTVATVASPVCNIDMYNKQPIIRSYSAEQEATAAGGASLVAHETGRFPKHLLLLLLLLPLSARASIPAADCPFFHGGPPHSSQLPLATVLAAWHARQQQAEVELPILLPGCGAPAAVWQVVLLELPAVQLIGMP